MWERVFFFNEKSTNHYSNFLYMIHTNEAKLSNFTLCWEFDQLGILKILGGKNPLGTKKVYLQTEIDNTVKIDVRC